MDIQRRRAVLVSGGVLAIALVIAGGIVFATQDNPLAKPVSSSTSASTTTTTSAPSKPAETAAPPAPSAAQPVGVEALRGTAPVDDRPGYGKLKLGMSKEDALATGLLTLLSPESNGCGSYSSVGSPYSASISDELGLVQIPIPDYAKTSAGIGVGSTVADVLAKYPHAQEFMNGYTVRVDDWYYRVMVTRDGAFRADDEVRGVIMEMHVDCTLS